MIGLPEETQEDILAIVDLVKKIVPKVSVKVSINVFVPKPFTPLQNFQMLPKNEIKKKMNFLKKEISKIKGAFVIIEDIVSSYRQQKIQGGKL